jgi:hypothetical protein
MKIPSLKLESKVLLTAGALCIVGILKMTHLIHLSAQEEMGLPFFLAMLLSLLAGSSDRDSAAPKAAAFLCIGLWGWAVWPSGGSPFDHYFEEFIGLVIATYVVFHSIWAIQDYLEANRKSTPSA